jgi:hypothetical protein
MAANETVVLTGVAIGNETATVTFRPQTCHADGIDIALSVKLLEYVFEVETFFYGYNFELFLKEAEEVISTRAGRAYLFNYDQTLVVEFIDHDGVTFRSLNYRSDLPQPAENKHLKVLRTASRLDSTSNIGSRYSLSFMPLHNALVEVTDWLTGVLADHPVSKENPYPH